MKMQKTSFDTFWHLTDCLSVPTVRGNVFHQHPQSVCHVSQHWEDHKPRKEAGHTINDTNNYCVTEMKRNTIKATELTDKNVHSWDSIRYL